jgi:t-SNARE complex subunit (syntaxin)
MEPISAVLITLAGAVASGLASGALQWLRGRFSPVDEQVQAEQTLESRMSALGRTMSDASQLMTLVQSEISARQEKISQLAGEVKQQEQLAALSKEAKDAVAAVFHGELVKEGRKAKWQAFWIGFAFFLLGSMVTFFVTYYVHPVWG